MEITICNAKVKTKLNNFIKTCDSLLRSGKDINRASMAINAFKVLRSFLKKESEYTPVLEMLDSKKDIFGALSSAKEIVQNEFTYIFEETADSTELQNGYRYKIGDIIQFGRKSVNQSEKLLEWKVIKVENGKALLFARKSVMWEPFDRSGDNEWEKSSLKQALNGQWAADVFSEDERESITSAPSLEGEADILDNIFILSVDELSELVPAEADRADRIAVWWTSTKAEAYGTVCCVKRNGEFDTDGISVTKRIGIRPALWIINPMTDDEEHDDEAEKAESVKSRKKIIIVVDGRRYYIAEAGEDDEITSSYLKKFAGDATHYTSLDEAKSAADRLADIYSSKFDVETVQLVLTELTSREYEKSNRRLILKDKYGYPVAQLGINGKATFPVREEDADLTCIDKLNYQKEIQKLIDAEKVSLKNNFDYYTIGKMTGYEVGFDCSAPRIRYEIFKAEDIIEGFDEYPEIRDVYTDDEKYYKGYIEALNDSLRIQHNHIFYGAEWSIEFIDLRANNAYTPRFATEEDSEQFGHYSLHIYNEIPKLNFDKNLHYVVMLIVDSSKPWACRDAELELDLPDDIPLILYPRMMTYSKPKLMQMINAALRQRIILGSGNTAFNIVADIVPSLMNLKSYFDDTADGENEAEVEGDDRENAADERFLVESNLKIDLRETEDEASVEPFQYRNNLTLTSIKLPNSLKKLPDGIFLNCISLDYVTLPSSLLDIGASSFEGCVLLRKLFLPDTIKNIRSRAFYGCNKLKSIYLPQNLEKIGSKAFCGCSSLKQIYFPPNIKYIAEDAFEDCNGLSKIRAPKGTVLPSALEKAVNIDYYPVERAQDFDTSAGGCDAAAVDIAALMNNIINLLENSNPISVNVSEPIIKLLEKEYKHD